MKYKQHESATDIVFESSRMEEMKKPFQPNYHFITSDDVDEEIMTFAEENNIDLLMVLPKRNGIVEGLIHKSHLRQMVLHSHIPVMALPSINIAERGQMVDGIFGSFNNYSSYFAFTKPFQHQQTVYCCRLILTLWQHMLKRSFIPHRLPL